MFINHRLDDPHVDPLTAYKERRDMELEDYYEERRERANGTDSAENGDR